MGLQEQVLQVVFLAVVAEVVVVEAVVLAKKEDKSLFAAKRYLLTSLLLGQTNPFQ